MAAGRVDLLAGSWNIFLYQSARRRRLYVVADRTDTKVLVLSGLGDLRAAYISATWLGRERVDHVVVPDRTIVHAGLVVGTPKCGRLHRIRSVGFGELPARDSRQREAM